MKYAAYGMNTNIHSMSGRCPGARCLGPALTYYMQPGAPDGPPGQSYWDMLTEGYAEHGIPVDQLYQELTHSQSVRSHKPNWSAVI